MTQWILSASLLIVAVLLIRTLAGDRISARLRYALWGLVLLRLLVPVSIGESALSVQNWMPDEQGKELTYEQMEQSADSGLKMETEQGGVQESVQMEKKSEQTVAAGDILPAIYVSGMLLVASVFLLSNLRFWLCLRRSRVLVDRQILPIYETAAIETPCMYGLLRPAVYVTPAVQADKTAQQYVLAHELTHYRHGDHVWSFLRCVAMVLHWYNPLVWTASFASQLDGELACDEGALRRIGEGSRNEYARTLINLTRVGYGGMLTTATSMTGRKCDLRNRVVRISKNPKMTVIALVAVLVIVAIIAVMLFTGATAPAIEGVWELKMDVLGEGVPEGATACVVYEFSDGYGRYALYMEEGLRIARGFTYTLSDNLVTITYSDTGEVEEHTWTVEDKTLTFGGGKRATHYTAREVKSVPYVPDDYWAPVSVVADYPDGVLYSDLTDTQQAQLLELLRSGYSGEKRWEVIDNDPYMINISSAHYRLTIANGLVYKQGPNSGEEGYVLSNLAEIEAWLGTLAWKGEPNRRLETSGFTPDAMTEIVQARMILDGKVFYADPAQLAFLEELLTTAVDLGWVSGCPFEGILEVTLSDGRVLGITPALDSCAAFMIGDTCYEYGNQFAYDDEGSYDNTALLAVFGLDYKMLEDMWAEVYRSQGEPIGTMEDIGDVVRVQNDVMEPTRLTDSTKETIIALLAEGMGESMGEEDVDFDSLYYTVLFETLGAADGFVTLSDNGSLYMDGVRYELRTAEPILQILDGHYNELRITQEGYDVTELSGVTGEFLYVELSSPSDDAQVTWSSGNEDVCTVTGDAYGAEIYVTGSGMAAVTVKWQGDNISKSDAVVVYGDREDYATAISEADLTTAEDMARKDYEAWRNEDYCIRMDVLLSDVDEAESVRLRMMYDGFEAGWTKDYLAENFVAVRVQYDCELDHEKVFFEDGIVTKYTLLVRDNANSPWKIWDYAMM